MQLFEDCAQSSEGCVQATRLVVRSKVRASANAKAKSIDTTASSASESKYAPPLPPCCGALRAPVQCDRPIDHTYVKGHSEGSSPVISHYSAQRHRYRCNSHGLHATGTQCGLVATRCLARRRIGITTAVAFPVVNARTARTGLQGSGPTYVVTKTLADDSLATCLHAVRPNTLEGDTFSAALARQPPIRRARARRCRLGSKASRRFRQHKWRIRDLHAEIGLQPATSPRWPQQRAVATSPQDGPGCMSPVISWHAYLANGLCDNFGTR